MPQSIFVVLSQYERRESLDTIKVDGSDIYRISYEKVERSIQIIWQRYTSSLCQRCMLLCWKSPVVLSRSYASLRSSAVCNPMFLLTFSLYTC